MNIDELTLGQAKDLAAMFSSTSNKPAEAALNGMIGKPVIVRTYSAGVWFGVLNQKAKNEVILVGARRLYQWWASESISLSAVAMYGIKQEKSKICAPVSEVWLEAIEIIPCSDIATKHLTEAKIVAAE